MVVEVNENDTREHLDGTHLRRTKLLRLPARRYGTESVVLRSWLPMAFKVQNVRTLPEVAEEVLKMRMKQPVVISRKFVEGSAVPWYASGPGWSNAGVTADIEVTEKMADRFERVLRMNGPSLTIRTQVVESE